jgi:hypothetical protein
MLIVALVVKNNVLLLVEQLVLLVGLVVLAVKKLVETVVTGRVVGAVKMVADVWQKMQVGNNFSTTVC